MSEPKATLYSQKWREARERVDAVEPATRPVFLSILDHMERGWRAFRPLQVWFAIFARDFRFLGAHKSTPRTLGAGLLVRRTRVEQPSPGEVARRGLSVLHCSLSYCPPTR